MQLLSSFELPYCNSEAAVRAIKKKEVKIAVILKTLAPTTLKLDFYHQGLLNIRFQNEFKFSSFLFPLFIRHPYVESDVI